MMSLKTKILSLLLVFLPVFATCLYKEYEVTESSNQQDAGADVELDSSEIDAQSNPCPQQKFCNDQCQFPSIDNGCFENTCEPCIKAPNLLTICDPKIGLGCIYQCKSPFEDCNKDLMDGCEIDLSIDNDEHCGECEKNCFNGEWHMNCVNKYCQCGGAWNDCNQDASDGCEQDFWADSSCGACDNMCPIDQHCQFGVCVNN